MPGQGKLPFIENNENLNDNLTSCEKRLARVLKQFSKDESLLHYRQTTTWSYHCWNCPEYQDRYRVVLYPHRHITRNDKIYRIIRMVYHASSKTSIAQKMKFSIMDFFIPPIDWPLKSDYSSLVLMMQNYSLIKAQHRLWDASFNIRKFESNSIDLESIANSEIPINDFKKLLRLLWNKKDD